MRRIAIMSFFLPLLVVFLCTGEAPAGTTGKITGRVMDTNGEALPGANVVIAGVRRGAATDAEGRYFILSVDPGVYRLEASLVGFRTVAQEDVQIAADFTTTIDFKLDELTLEADEIVVRAVRPLVEPDKTSSKYVVSAEEIEALPMVRSAADFAELQGGVSVEGDWRIRGGDAADGAVYIDGVRIVNNDARSLNRFMGVNTNAIQELQVITGGMEAEYGNAQSGIIRIVTKDGSSKLQGLAEYRNTPPSKKHWGPNVYDHPTVLQQAKWSDPAFASAHPRQDYTKTWGNELDLSLSGPLVGNTQFFVSTRWDGRQSRFPSASTRQPFNTQNNAKLVSNLTPNLKVRVGGLYERHKTWNGDGRGIGNSFRNLFLPEDWAASGEKLLQEDLQYLSLTHTITARTFYEVRLSRSASTIETRENPAATTSWKKDSFGYFYSDRSLYAPEDSKRIRYNLKADLSSQVTKANLVKMGLDMTLYDVWWTWLRHSTESNREIRFIGKDHQQGEGVDPLQVAWYLQDRVEFEGIVLNGGIRLDYFNHRKDDPLTFLFGTTPMYNSLLRFRNAPTLQSESLVRWSPRVGISHPITDRSTLRFFYGKFFQLPQFQLWFGETWKAGTTDDRNQDGTVQAFEEYSGYTLLQGNQHGSTRDVGPEQTTSFEVGLDWNFVSNYVLSMTTYYKSAINQARGGSQTNYRDPLKKGKNIVGPSHVINGYTEDSRGFEFSLKKQFSHHFAFQMAYNVQWATEDQTGWRGAKTVVDSLFLASGEFWRKRSYDPSTGVETPIPLPESEIIKFGRETQAFWRSENLGVQQNQPFRYWFPDEQYKASNGGQVWLLRSLSGGNEARPRGDIDQRAFGSLQILVSTPSNFGPTLGSFSPLSDWRMNAIYRLDTGTPFQYSAPDGPTVWVNAPLRTRSDMSAERTFHLGPYEAIFYTEISNVFNTHDLRNDGPFSNNQPAFDWMQWGLSTPRPDNTKFQQYGDEKVLDRFTGTPRAMVLGLRLKF